MPLERARQPDHSSMIGPARLSPRCINTSRVNRMERQGKRSVLAGLWDGDVTSHVRCREINASQAAEPRRLARGDSGLPSRPWRLRATSASLRTQRTTRYV